MDTVRRNDTSISGSRSDADQGRSAARRAWPVIASYAALATILVIAAAGFAVWAVAAPRPRAVQFVIPTPSPLTVQVDGAVAHPGVYTLPAGSRAQDAIEAAGGLTSESSVNLAMPLVDGQRLVATDLEAEKAAQAASQPVMTGDQTAKIDLNTATQDELETLPGIGPTRAAAIIDFRDRNGPIQFLDDLQLVSGIGPSTIENLRPLVTQQ